MRFWRSLLFVTLAIVLFVLSVFALPLLATTWVLLVTMVLSPAVWLSGASYAQGGRQAFFRGGLVCGILPFVVSLLVFVMLAQSESTWKHNYATATAPPPMVRYSTTAPAPLTPNPYAPTNQPPDTNLGTPSTLVANGEPSFPAPSLSDPPQIGNTVPVLTPYSQPVTVAYEIQTVSVFDHYLESVGIRLMFAGLWLAPGVLAFLGGGLSWLTHRLLTRPTASPSPAELDDELRTLTERTAALCAIRESNVPSEV